MNTTTRHAGRRLVSLLLVLALALSLVPAALAATADAADAAQALYDLGLFRGTGTNADGTPIFDLDRTPTRNQALIMLVRLLGHEADAAEGTWTLPFTDVSEKMTPYVGYAYENGLTAGTSATTFGGTNTIRANQYITFVLRALGYESGTDFKVSTACDFSDQIGLTHGEYTASSTFTRGDVASISYDALFMAKKGGTQTLAQELGLTVTKMQPTPTKLCRGYWVGVNQTDSGLFAETYYFSGSNYSCTYTIADKQANPICYGYEEGTFTVSGDTLTLHQTKDYTLKVDSSVTELDKSGATNTYTVTPTDDETMKLNGWTYHRYADAASSFTGLRDKVLAGYVELNSADYAYLAGADFRSVRRHYSAATAQAGYVYAFLNKDGQKCVLTVVNYKIISNYIEYTLHNLSTGRTISNPSEYYDKLADRAYGASRIHYMDLSIEVLEYQGKMLSAIVNVLKGGANTFDGVFVSAEELNL